MRLINIRALRWGSFIAYVAGGGLSGVFFIKTHSAVTMSVALISAAGALRALLPAQSVDRNAPVVANDGKKVAYNLSSTSDLDLVRGNQAPSK